MKAVDLKSITCTGCRCYAVLDENMRCEFCRLKSAPAGTIDDPFPGLPQIGLAVLAVGGVIALIVWAFAR